jgi:SAM-dependent methyltransferase
MRTIVCAAELTPNIPIPPPRFVELTQGDHNAVAYKMLGFRFYHQFREIASRHRDLSMIRRIFDWGCGSGRVASFFLTDPIGPEVFGGDLDHDAAAWCQEHLKPGHFRALDPLPPLPYHDEMFDLILSIGVVGGCGPAEYAVWLPELRRVLAPGGLVLITIQGRFKAEVLYPPDALAMLECNGLFDGSAYDQQHPPNPKDTRYRGGMYLTRDYVSRTWSPYFRVVEHLEGELNSDLDIVVLQRPN